MDINRIKSETKSDQNFIVVVRSAGERTVDVCKDLIVRDIGTENVRVIECVPFESAIKESFRIGIESNKKWLITVDADVLIRKNAIQELIQIAELLPESIFKVEGMLFDGLLLIYREGGVKVYRTELLSHAMDLIPAPGTQIRPETNTLDAMMDQGYSNLRVDTVVGLHDFEQNYKDVFRKCFVHARKHKVQTKDLMTKWKKLAEMDPYYKAAIKGAEEGFHFQQSIPIDTRFFNNYFDNSTLDFIKQNQSETLEVRKVEELIGKTLDIYKYDPKPNLIKKIQKSYELYGLKVLFKKIKRNLFRVFS